MFDPASQRKIFLLRFTLFARSSIRPLDTMITTNVSSSSLFFTSLSVLNLSIHNSYFVCVCTVGFKRTVCHLHSLLLSSPIPLEEKNES